MQWLKFSLAIAATRDRIPVSACGRVEVARPWFSQGSPPQSDVQSESVTTAFGSFDHKCRSKGTFFFFYLKLILF